MRFDQLFLLYTQETQEWCNEGFFGFFVADAAIPVLALILPESKPPIALQYILRFCCNAVCRRQQKRFPTERNSVGCLSEVNGNECPVDSESCKESL